MLKQFDRIAGKYDLANDLISFGMHRLWKKRAVAELLSGSPASKASGASPRYLDVCTGTGDLALLIAAKAGSEATVVGIDVSSEMLAVASQRSQKDVGCGARLSFQQGDAHKLPFADQSFDGAVISFGLRNLTDLQLGLNEMARVVRQGGKVICLDLGKPEIPVFTPLFYFFFNHVVPLIGAVIFHDHDAYRYLPESGKQFPHPARISEMFKNAQLTDVRFINLAGGSVALHTGTAP